MRALHGTGMRRRRTEAPGLACGVEREWVKGSCKKKEIKIQRGGGLEAQSGSGQRPRVRDMETQGVTRRPRKRGKIRGEVQT